MMILQTNQPTGVNNPQEDIAREKRFADRLPNTPQEDIEFTDRLDKERVKA